MEEQKQFIMRHPKMTELARDLSIMSKNIGDVGFSIKYPATEGNISIHENFIRFAFDETNGDYIVAIGKLLDYCNSSKRIDSIEDRVGVLEVFLIDNVNKEEVKEPVKVEDDVKKIKVF